MIQGTRSNQSNITQALSNERHVRMQVALIKSMVSIAGNLKTVNKADLVLVHMPAELAAPTASSEVVQLP